MRIFFFINLLIILAFNFSTLAQDKPLEKWTRFETANKEISASFPPGYLVDMEKRDNDRIFHAVGFQNGVTMQMRIFKFEETKVSLKYVWFPEGLSTSFTANGLQGKRGTFLKKDYFSETIYLVSGKFFYSFIVSARSNQPEEVKRFLYSIQIKGKPLFTQTSKDVPTDEIISIPSLKTSPEIIEVFSRKYIKQNAETTYKSLMEHIPEEWDNETRPAIEVERADVGFVFGQQSYRNNITTFEAMVKVTVLANGQVGDVTVYSDNERDFAKYCAETARKSRYIPAQRNGKFIDSILTVNYTMQIYTGLPRN